MTSPTIAGRSPYGVEVEEGKIYFWCACGLSRNQPFSRARTRRRPSNRSSGSRNRRRQFFCACKQTDGQPFCDGSHKNL